MDIGIPLPVVIAHQDNPIARAGQAWHSAPAIAGEFLPQLKSLAAIGSLVVSTVQVNNLIVTGVYPLNREEVWPDGKMRRIRLRLIAWRQVDDMRQLSPRRCWRGVCAMLLICFSGLAAQSVIAGDPLHIETRDGQVRLTAEEVELRHLLQELADRADFKLWISSDLPTQAVTADIATMPLQDALGRLLEANSFALVYGAGGAVSALYVLPTGESQPLRASLDSETTDIQEQILQNALASEMLSDHIKAAMLSQHNNNSDSVREALAAQRPEAIRKLIETLQEVGSPSSATLQRLEQLHEREVRLQSEQ